MANWAEPKVRHVIEKRTSDIMKEYGYATFWIFLLHKQLASLGNTLKEFERPQPSEENKRYEEQLQSIRNSNQPLTEEIDALLQRNQTLGAFLAEAARLEFCVLHRFFPENFSQMQTDAGCKVALLEIKSIRSDLQSFSLALDDLDTWLERTEFGLDDEVFHDQLSLILKKRATFRN